MQVSVEKPSALERRMTVEIEEERIAEEVLKRLKDLCKSARLDGFRQGRAPLSVVRQRFGPRVRDEVVGELLQSSFGEAMGSEDFQPAGQPTIDEVSSEAGKGLTYTAVFEVFPEISIAPLNELKIDRESCEITDADVDEMIEKLREQHKQWVEVERASADGDQLAINFVGTIDGEPFEGGTGEDFDLVLGTGMMIDGFEEGLREQVAGAKVDLDLKFPDEYRNEPLAGKAVSFAIEVKRVSESVLPEVDSEFMQKFGAADGDMDAFRSEIRTNMDKERERALNQRFNSEVMEKVSDANDFNIPNTMIEAEAGRLREQFTREMAMRGVDPAASQGDEFETSVRDQARKRVKLGLLMAEIIKQGELSANPDKVREMIENMASSYEDSAAVVKWYYDNPEQMRQVEALCLENVAVEWIADQAQKTDLTVTFDALMNPVQTDDNSEASS